MTVQEARAAVHGRAPVEARDSNDRRCVGILRGIRELKDGGSVVFLFEPVDRPTRWSYRAAAHVSPAS